MMEGLNRELPKMDKEKYEAVPEETIKGIAAFVMENYAGSTPEDKQVAVNILVAKLPELLAEAKAKREEVKTVH